MAAKLRSVDAHAVDLLLNRAAIAHQQGQPQSAFGSHGTNSAGMSNDRINAVEKVLGLLNAMPPAEPTASLVAQTLARVESHILAPLEMPAQPMIDANRPLA